MNKALRYILVVTIMLFLIMNTSVINIFAYTVDDLRDLVGKQRVSTQYTKSEIADIITKYNDIERKNLYVKMFKLGKEITMDKTIEDELKGVEKRIEILSTELEKKYKEGIPIKEILNIKTQLEVEVLKANNLAQRGYYVDIEYKENKWSEEYEKVKEAIKNMSEDFVIGDIGDTLKSPVYSGFRITSPFGFRIDPITLDALTFHSGIDLGAPLDDYIFSLWNGVVSNVYESESGGKTVEIAHGPHLKTRYLHLNYIDVGIGQKVTQYDIIGGAGSTGIRSTGTHLHLEIILDGENINPLYVFGNNGLRAFKEYISYNPERNRELYEVEKNIKGTPTKDDKDDKEVKKESKYYRPSLIQEGDIITFVQEGVEEPNPFTYDIPIGLSKDEQELIDFIERVIKKNEENQENKNKSKEEMIKEHNSVEKDNSETGEQE